VVLRAVASPSWLQTLAILQFSEGRAFRPCSKVLQPVKGAGYGNHVINWAWAGNSAGTYYASYGFGGLLLL
jgi:hypothetical protein